jgi:hypothetical protein
MNTDRVDFVFRLGLCGNSMSSPILVIGDIKEKYYLIQ